MSGLAAVRLDGVDIKDLFAYKRRAPRTLHQPVHLQHVCVGVYVCVCVCVSGYIYIYIYVYQDISMHICIYIHIYENVSAGTQHQPVHLHKNI